MNKDLYESTIWKGLLHLNKNEKPSINTPTFLLSYKSFSAKNELESTVKAFQDDKKSICKYPARYDWLSKNSDLVVKAFDFKSCKGFYEYRKKTHPHTLSLVFISEDVSNPTSMMGHLFFKLDGINHKGQNVENAISFFTIIDTINLPYLALESTVLGMQGYFILKPYHKQIAQYTKNENRNIWEYSLDFTDEDLKLLSYHFWELKDVDLKYYFTGYNCATIVNDMLNIVSKDNNKESFNLWLTPKDVLKKAANRNLIKETTVKNATTLAKNPVLSQNDSQISIFAKTNEESLYLSFLPASHTLFDDNRQYSFESQLKIGEVTVKLDKSSMSIDELNLFTMQSLVPWNSSEKLSKELEINYTKRDDENLNAHSVYNLSYSMGLTYKLYNDIFISNLLGAGVARGDDTTFFYGKNEVTLMIYEVFNMKTTFQYTSYFNNFKSKKFNNTLDMTQSIKLNKDIRFDIGYQHNQVRRYQNENFKFGLSYIF